MTDCTEELCQVEAVSMPVRVYSRGSARRSAPLVLHFHGGAFVTGSLEAGRRVSMLLAEAGAVVVSADYPLAPAHPFPQALEAAYGALDWLHQHRGKWVSKRSGIFVAGEEAGGNLAAGLTLMARDQQAPALAGQILISPMLDASMATCSIREAEAGPVGCRWADGWHQYLRSADKAAHPYASPLASSRLAGLPPALVLTAEDDLMRDESLSYARRLREAGVVVEQHVLPAPTGWPDSLDRLPQVEAPSIQGPSPDAPWTDVVRDRFASFFADNSPSRRSAASLPSDRT
jgi:acetyl esterase/lipase